MFWLGLLAALLVIIVAGVLVRSLAYRRTIRSVRANLRRYAQENRALARASDETPLAGRIILFGDAIAERWDIAQDFPELAFLNRGIAGETTLQLLARFQQDVIDLEPRAVILFGGKNDPAARLPVSATQDHLQLMARLAAKHGVELVVASLLPLQPSKRSRWQRPQRLTPAYVAAMNSWLRLFAQARGLEYVDFHSALTDAKGWMRAGFTDDGVHPNANGYRAMAGVLCPALERILERARPSRPAGRRAARS